MAPQVFLPNIVKSTSVIFSYKFKCSFPDPHKFILILPNVDARVYKLPELNECRHPASKSFLGNLRRIDERSAYFRENGLKLEPELARTLNL